MVALGIFAFCIVGIVALLSTALNSSRASLKDSALSAALRRLDSEMRALPAATLTNNGWYATNRFYFDTEGNYLTNSNGCQYQVQLQRIEPDRLGGLVGTTNSHSHFLWSAEFSYPPPAFREKSHLLIGRAFYGSGLTNFRE